MVSISLHSQGFDWQYSPRLPFETPDLFVGLSAEGSYFDHFGNFPLEEFGANLCCNHRSGGGVGFSIGINAENWINGYSALWASISFSVVNGSFSSNNSLLVKNEEELISKYDSETTAYYISAKFNWKYRLFSSNFWIAPGVNLHFYAGSNLLAIMTFPNLNGDSDQIEIDAEMPDMLILYPAPTISIGYNKSSGFGRYLSPYSSIEFPLFDASAEGEWRMWRFSLGMAIHIGIN